MTDLRGSRLCSTPTLRRAPPPHVRTTAKASLPSRRPSRALSRYVSQSSPLGFPQLDPDIIPPPALCRTHPSSIAYERGETTIPNLLTPVCAVPDKIPFFGVRACDDSCMRREKPLPSNSGRGAKQCARAPKPLSHRHEHVREGGATSRQKREFCRPSHPPSPSPAKRRHNSGEKRSLLAKTNQLLLLLRIPEGQGTQDSASLARGVPSSQTTAPRHMPRPHRTSLAAATTLCPHGAPRPDPPKRHLCSNKSTKAPSPQQTPTSRPTSSIATLDGFLRADIHHTSFFSGCLQTPSIPSPRNQRACLPAGTTPRLQYLVVDAHHHMGPGPTSPGSARIICPLSHAASDWVLVEKRVLDSGSSQGWARCAKHTDQAPRSPSGGRNHVQLKIPRVARLHEILDAIPRRGQRHNLLRWGIPPSYAMSRQRFHRQGAGRGQRLDAECFRFESAHALHGV